MEVSKRWSLLLFLGGSQDLLLDPVEGRGEEQSSPVGGAFVSSIFRLSGAW